MYDFQPNRDLRYLLDPVILGLSGFHTARSDYIIYARDLGVGGGLRRGG